MDIAKFLQHFGGKEEGSPGESQWDRVIQPHSSYLILGDVGTGKSGLAHWLLEKYSKKYDLLPGVVGLPRAKQDLIPSDFIVVDDPRECKRHENAILFIDEADLQLPMDAIKQKQYVVNFLSLPRQRHQIFLLAFHFPRLVMGTYLPFFRAFLLKRPPYLKEFAGKDQSKIISEMMDKAEERFAELPSEDLVVRNTYVVAPRIRWQGMLENPLPSFWSQDLSEVWAGTEIEKGINLFDMGSAPSPQRRRWVTAPEEIEARPGEFGIEPIYEGGIIVGFTVLDPEGSVIRKRAAIVKLLHAEYPGVSIAELEDSAISYFDYRVDVDLRRK